jgi:acyl dehydratase
MHYDDDQTYRYAEASGDRTAFHLDDDVARAAGHPGKIVHGLCTMAMASRAIVSVVCEGDPARLARIAGRFGAPAFPGNDLTVTIYDAGDGGYAYEAESGGAVVMANGRAEVR